MITLRCDIDAARAQVHSLQADQLPYIIARSLTAVAVEAQTSVRILEGQVFKLRNDWTTRNTKIIPATKTNFAATIYTDTENRSTGAKDYLPVQQDSGEKVPFAGHKHLAIPTRYLRRIAPGIIPDGLRPKNLLPPDATLGATYSGSFRTPGVKPLRALGRDSRKKLGSNDFSAFVQNTKSGSLCIFVRHGGIGYHGGSQDAEPWYVLVPEAEIKARFPMEKEVQDVVEREFASIFVTVAGDVGITVGA